MKNHLYYPEIDVVLHDISIIVNPRHVKIYVAKAFNIFRKVMLTDHVERKNILVNVFAIPYAYPEEDKMRLVDTLHSRDYEYSVYLKNLPHQDLEPGSFVSNSPYADNGSFNGMVYIVHQS